MVARGGGYFKEAVTLFHDMAEENVEPNMETYEGLIFVCGKGGLYQDAKEILLHMNGKGLVPSPKAYTGVIEAYGQAALYEEAIVAFNTMNEVGSSPSVETYNSLIHAFARGGLYMEIDAILTRMDEAGVPWNKDSFDGVIEGCRQAGQFKDAVKAYIGMDKAVCDPDEQTLEAVLSVYCFAALVEVAEEQFEEIKAFGIPSVMCYCMMIAAYAKTDRLIDAYELLSEMLNNRTSSIHQVIAQMIKGDFDDESNWQMIEFVFDKLNFEGRAFRMRFYNTLLEALWWLGQKERAARVLKEATKRGLFPELFRKSKLVWSLDVHRMWPGSACTALSLWFTDMLKMFKDRARLPQLATVVVVRGKMENSPKAKDFPVAQVVYSFLKENISSSSFSFAVWNKGRVICQRAELKKLLSELEQFSGQSEEHQVIKLTNTPLSLPLSTTSTSISRRDQNSSTDTQNFTRIREELVPSAA